MTATRGFFETDTIGFAGAGEQTDIGKPDAAAGLKNLVALPRFGCAPQASLHFRAPSSECAPMRVTSRSVFSTITTAFGARRARARRS